MKARTRMSNQLPVASSNRRTVLDASHKEEDMRRTKLFNNTKQCSRNFDKLFKD